mmetsp:Transcript_33500/g.81475  ORF Transcript_33500/g.81475 Transcript_33500/m.81475 type:complete len:256 (+) Transcript_33500:29-796(+)
MGRAVALLLLSSHSICLAKRGAKASGSTPGGFDAHHKVMQLLTPQARGCEASNGTTIGVSTPLFTAPAYCGTRLPKRRQCVCLSFSNGLAFGSALAAVGCKVFSFDPSAGVARSLSPSHTAVPADIGTFDGIAKEGNTTFVALTLKSIMDSQEIERVDLLRMTVHSVRQWRTLKSLVNLGWLDGVLQLSLNMTFSDITMWSEYQNILTMVSNHGFKPYYVVKQPGAEYLQVQEGAFSLYSKYEVGMGNVKRKSPA